MPISTLYILFINMKTGSDVHENYYNLLVSPINQQYEGKSLK